MTGAGDRGLSPGDDRVLQEKTQLHAVRQVCVQEPNMHGSELAVGQCFSWAVGQCGVARLSGACACTREKDRAWPKFDCDDHTCVKRGCVAGARV
eukprot:363903-Chlamydomonas_euryale.AAC.3